MRLMGLNPKILEKCLSFANEVDPDDKKWPDFVSFLVPLEKSRS